MFKYHIKILSIKSNYRCWLKSSKGVYATVLKSSLAMIENPEWRIFLMKDLSAAEEAQKQGAKLMEVEVKF